MSFSSLPACDLFSNPPYQLVSRSQIGAQSESAHVGKIFTIAYGDDADEIILERIAERTCGRSFQRPHNCES